MMQDSDKILSRLIGILKKLSNNEKPRVKELASYFNVTQRTIQRDLYQRLLYFPIEKNNHSQLQFINGFALEQSVLDNDEMLFTYLTLSKIKDENPHFEEKVHKILRKLIKPQHKTTEEFSSQHTYHDVNDEIINRVEDAILHNKVLLLQCKDKSLTFNPYKLIKNKDHMIMMGEDCKDKKVKSIPLHKIKNVHIQKKKFTIKKSLDETLNNVHSSFFATHQVKEFEAIINEEVASHFLNAKTLPHQEILKVYEDGSLSVKFITENVDDVESIIKHWMPYIKITKPKIYHERIISKMKDYIEICSN